MLLLRQESLLCYLVVSCFSISCVRSLAAAPKREGVRQAVRDCLLDRYSDVPLSCTSISDMLRPSSSSFPTTPPLRQELFSSPLISVMYERILPPLWSAGLRIGGPDAEYQEAARFLRRPSKEASTTEVALDLSCGTGFVGVRMAASQQWDHVFCLDYSPQMLQECASTIRNQYDASLPLSIIRGDAGRLPFRDESLQAVHWGAAMHCVPDAEQALREVYRVLKPGGKLYATTFLRPFPDVIFRFFTLPELEQMTKRAGFDGMLQVEGRGVYGIIRATKG